MVRKFHRSFLSKVFLLLLYLHIKHSTLQTTKTWSFIFFILKLEQIEALAGGLDWFGPGSRVIITTRDKHLLACHGITSTHAVEGLNETEALQLLRRMAFKNDKVPSSYEDTLNRVVTYASGLPLAIVTIGANLFGRKVEDWKRTLDEYENIPDKDIQRILQVSYDALNEKDQSVFLDIACCFKGCVWAEVRELLHAHYGHCIEHHVGVLAEKSLIGHWEYDTYVTLHDLIEDMGKEVVRQESPKNPGERSRLWFSDDIVNVLRDNTVSKTNIYEQFVVLALAMTLIILPPHTSVFYSLNYMYITLYIICIVIYYYFIL